MTMLAHFDGRVFVPDGPVALSVGHKVRVEAEPIDEIDDDPDPPGTIGDPQHNDPESIARWIAESDAIPAAVITPEEEADWLEYRKQQNVLHEAKMDALIKRINESSQ